MRKLPVLILALVAASVGTAAYAIGSSPPAPLTNVRASPANANKSAGVFNGFTQQEVDTTAIHAEHAYQSKDVADVQAHLRHVINCLEGPKGPDFDAKLANPCANMGSGALNDVPANSDARKKLDQALSDAKDGLAKTTMDDAHDQAKKVLNDVEKVQSQYKQ